MHRRIPVPDLNLELRNRHFGLYGEPFVITTHNAQTAAMLLTLAPIIPLLAFAVVVALALSGLPIHYSLPWVPSLGITLDFRIDGLSLIMLLMITGIGIAVFTYAGGYMQKSPSLHRLYGLLTAFMVAMIGCVTADNLILLFLCWEATSLISFLLVGFDHEREASRKSSQQAMIVTGSGGLALLAGILLLGQQLGSYNLTELLPRLAGSTQTPPLVAALLLILLGALTKSAQVPFHFWLPNAMAAPTPVSAYLHSATMVKLGVFLLARLDPGFGHWPIWALLLQGIGSLTAAWAMLLAIRERDLKRILAWSTVATLGTLVSLVGLPGEGGAIATGGLLMAHALYKAPLFFVAGNIDHGTGTRVIDQLGGLRRSMPWTAAAALLAGISMAGLPLSFGYAVKAAIAAAKDGSDILPWMPVANALFSTVAVSVAGVAAVRVFWWHPGHNVTPPAHEGGPLMILPPLLLALTGALFGLYPSLIQSLVANASVAMISGDSLNLTPFATRHLAASTVLLTSAGTLLGGILLYFAWDPLHRLSEYIAARCPRLGAQAHYERILSALPRLAAVVTRFMQNGHLDRYSSRFLLISALGLLGALATHRTLSLPPAGQLPLPVAGATLLIVIGAIACCRAKQPLARLLALGLVGYASALFFLFAGAPDVALTQLAVETVFVLVVVGVLGRIARLPDLHVPDDEDRRPSRLLIAVLFAATLTTILAVSLGLPFDPALSSYYAEQSLPAAQGRNVVNVILVDFRALDTLGEISVVLGSLLAAASLIGYRKAS